MSQLDDVNIDNTLLTASYEREIDVLTNSLTESNNVSLKLQKHECTMRGARTYLDSVLESHRKLDTRLTPLARILHSTCFESALIKIQDFREEILTMTKKRNVGSLWIGRANVVEVNIASDSIARRGLKHLCTSMTTKIFDYTDTRYLILTSFFCERPLSISGLALSSRRRAVLPLNFESQMFLYMKNRYLGINDVNLRVSDKPNTYYSED